MPRVGIANRGDPAVVTRSRREESKLSGLEVQLARFGAKLEEEARHLEVHASRLEDMGREIFDLKAVNKLSFPPEIPVDKSRPPFSTHPDRKGESRGSGTAARL